MGNVRFEGDAGIRRRFGFVERIGEVDMALLGQPFQHGGARRLHRVAVEQPAQEEIALFAHVAA